MPAKPRWWGDIQNILATLDSLEAGWLDRAMIEKIFKVRRRRAIELLNQFGGFQTGRTYLVERATVIERLRSIQLGEAYYWDQKRRRRLSEALSDARQYSQAVRVRIAAPLTSTQFPQGVHLAAGRMTIDFRDVEDLLSKLFSIARTAAEDFESFRKAASET